jgi:hypothetical protein
VYHTRGNSFQKPDIFIYTMASQNQPQSNTTPSFNTIYKSLQAHPSPLLPPQVPLSKDTTHQISNLQIHPTLEIALHILNHDLESAHFLVRHMQAAPQHEAMFLHGTLHRIEGDYDNARAWYGDVAESEVFKSVWKEGKERALEFIRRVEVLRKERKSEGWHEDDKEEREKLEAESRREIDAVVEFCVEKFGTVRWEDVSSEWAQPRGGKVAEQKQKMVVGGEGFRQF